MRLVELSNHPRGMLRDIHRQRDADGQRAQARYERELAHHAEQVEGARARRDAALARRRWWAWIRGIFALWGRKRRVFSAKPVGWRLLSGSARKSPSPLEWQASGRWRKS